MTLFKWKRLQHRQTIEGGEVRIVIQRREGEIQLNHIRKKRAVLGLTFVRKRAGVLSMATRRHLEHHVSHSGLHSENLLTDSAGAGFAPCRAVYEGDGKPELVLPPWLVSCIGNWVSPKPRTSKGLDSI